MYKKVSRSKKFKVLKLTKNGVDPLLQQVVFFKAWTWLNLSIFDDDIWSVRVIQTLSPHKNVSSVRKLVDITQQQIQKSSVH